MGGYIGSKGVGIISGIDASIADLNLTDKAAANGVTEANKVLTADANKDVTAIRNLAATGDVTAGGAITATGASVGALARGAIQTGNASGVAAPLTKGAEGTVLTAGANDLSWVAASAGGEATFTATGAITAGNPVGFNANGTVSAMQQTIGTAAALGSGASSTNGGRQTMAYDTALNKYLHIFVGTNNNMFARVGTVSGFGITFGTAVDSGRVMNWPDRGTLHVIYDDNAEKFVCSYVSTNNYGYASTITISGTTPSFGTQVTVSSATNYHSEIGYDSNANKVVFISAGNGNVATGRVGTISGTDITLGSEANLGGTGLYAKPGSLTFDTNVNKFIYVYGTASSGYAIKARTLTISGTSVSAGTEVDVASGAGNKLATAIFDPSINKTVALYYTGSSQFRLLTISGTSITQGTETSIPLVTNPTKNGFEIVFNACVNPDTAGLILSYSTGTAEARITPVKFSGANMTLSGEILVSSTKNQGGIIYDPDTDQPIVTTIDEDQIVSLANDGVRPAYVGVAAESISNGATGKVTIIGGVNANQSSLSAGTQYGIPVSSASLVATDTDPVGIAISSTEIYLRAVSL